MSDALAIVIVTYNSAAEVDGLVASLRLVNDDGDEVVVVDNASTDATVERLRGLDRTITVLEQAANTGFGGGCRAGAEATSAPLLLFLNPDSRLVPGALERLRAVADERPEWAAWQPALMLPDGRVNSGGGVVHYLGFGWAGQFGEPASALADQPHEIAFASGAALVIRREAWEAAAGFDDSYFLYGEDLDLGLRLWLGGRRVGIEPRALVVHDYEFDKGTRKWYLLERNRWRTLLADYPPVLLVALAPALLGAELALLAVAARGGWLAAKLRADAAAVVGLPRALRRRRAVQAARAVGAGAFASRLSASLDSPYIEGVPRWLAGAQAAYFAVVRALLRSFGDRPC